MTFLISSFQAQVRPDQAIDLIDWLYCLWARLYQIVIVYTLMKVTRCGKNVPIVSTLMHIDRKTITQLRTENLVQP